jgi:GTP-binding protein Era
VATNPEQRWQLVLVDLPGVQRPRDALTERMQRRVERELAEVDVALLVVNGEQGVGPGDRFIAGRLLTAQADERTPVICAVNKVDRLRRAKTAAALAAAAELDGVDEVFPISARTGAGLEPLVAALVERSPEGPFLYPPDVRSDQPSEIHLAEEVHAQIWVEADSQKGIVIGRAGRMIGAIGTAARRELERELGAHVFLELRVRVRDRWRRDAALLDRLGIE